VDRKDREESKIRWLSRNHENHAILPDSLDRWLEDLAKRIDAIRPPRRLVLWAQLSLGLMLLLLTLRVALQIEVPELAINLLALSGLAATAFLWYDHVKHGARRRREKQRAMPPPPGEHIYRAYTGIGVVFAFILSIPGALFAFLLFFYVLAYTAAVELAAAGGWLLFAAWFGFCLRSFAPVTLEILQGGVRSWFPRLHTETPVVSWSQYKGRHLIGPIFYVPPLWSLPLSWFVVRRSRDFRRDLTKHGQGSVG
jgi:hypothetical protein